MPRLPDPDPASFPDDVREFVAAMPPDPMVRMLAHSAGTVQPFVRLAKELFTALTLPERSRELVILAVAACTGSSFVAAQHEPIARSAGVDERTRQLVREKRFDDAGLAPEDRILLRFTAEVVRQPRVPDEVFAQARTFLTDREVAEVLQVVGYYWTFGRISTTLDVEVTEIYGDEQVLKSLSD